MENLKDIKAISIDLDGTLFRSDGTIDPQTVETLNLCKTRGMLLIFNTARPMKMVPKELFRYFSNEWWVFSNGTTCVKDGKTEFHHVMNCNDLSAIIKKLHVEYPNYFFSIEADGNIYTCFECDATRKKYFAESRKLSYLFTKNINKLIIVAEDNNFPVEQLRPLVSKRQRILVTENGKYVQIMPKKVSKLSAVKGILKDNGLTLNNLLSFGDDLNDIELITASKIGVAMGNAVPIVKRYADYVTTSNDKNGVGIFLHEFFHFSIATIN